MKRTTQIVQGNSIKTSLECTWAGESSAGSGNVHLADLIFFYFQSVYIKWTQTNIIHYSTCINLTSKRIFIFYFYVFVHKRDINKFGTRNVLLSTEWAVNHTLSRQCLELYWQVTIETRQCKVVRICVVDITTELP